MMRAYFCNSGAESVEAALKLTRRATGKSTIVAAERAFHGRTLGALGVTYKSIYREPFRPLSEATFVPYNDAEALKAVVTNETGAVILEPVQGEAGVYVADVDYLRAARRRAARSWRAGSGTEGGYHCHRFPHSGAGASGARGRTAAGGRRLLRGARSRGDDEGGDRSPTPWRGLRGPAGRSGAAVNIRRPAADCRTRDRPMFGAVPRPRSTTMEQLPGLPRRCSIRWIHRRTRRLMSSPVRHPHR